MIIAHEADRPAMTAFLNKHIATSMFPLSNLHRYGMTGHHRHASKIWLRWRAGQIADLLAVSNEGMLFPQCPNRPWGEVKTVLTGQALKGIIGDTAQVAELRHLLNLPDQAALDTTEPLYQLRLDDLNIPDHAGFSLRPLADAPRPLVIGWRRAYITEVLPMPGDNPDQKAHDDIASYIERDTHRVLYEGDRPVAMTGFNATLSEAVQIGGVYTPPADRGRGLARRAVALHLQEARAKGVQDAVLFAASTQAAKAYEAIGFAQSGYFSILIYAKPQVIYG